ncbi:uncharacterized protein LOC116417596 [Nasonia vitripennis]|uniref:Uncharacterized protein n=1 Tax=Nasonia vitripennis TaxID=7425 RepID=A0A7M7QIU7_NASVI|nr:uncharacterized protein LOC116417596 [Nasonia vitripennis]
MEESIKTFATDFAVDTLSFKLLRRFSSRKILSQAIHHSEFFANYKSLYTGNKRQLIVLLLTDDQTLKIFEQFTKIHNLSMYAWFIVFWARRGTALHDYCEKPKVNRFHLNFDVRMLVKCLENPEIREWYALDPKAEVRVNELMEWMPGTGLIRKTKLTFYQRRRDFNGKLLKVSTVKELVRTAGNSNKIEDRPIELMMTEMMRYMNFNVSFQQPIPNYGLFNQTEQEWNGMLGNLSRGEIDMCFTDITMTRQRHRYFDYTWPLFMTPNVLYIKKVGKSAVKWNAYSKAFDYKIWISIMILMTIASIAVTIIKAKIKQTYGNKNSFLENQLYVWGIFCQQGLPAFPDSSPLRIAYVSMFFCAIVITAAFSGSIISNLTNLAIVLPFTSFKEFVSLGTYKLTVMKNSFDHEYFTYNQDPIVAKMKQMMVRDKDLPANNVEGLQQICREKAAFYTNEAMKNKVAKTVPCKITAILTGGNRFMALPLSKNNPLTGFLNHHEEELQSFGNFTKDHNLAFHNWLVIFYGMPTKSMLDFCEKPPDNRLNLNIDYHVLVKCYDSEKIREWYASKARDTVKTLDLIEWKAESGLIVRNKKNVYDRRRDFGGAELKIAAMMDQEQLPRLTADGQMQHIDVYQNIIYELINAMNFSVTLLPAVKTYGRFDESQNKWIGFMGEILAGNIEVPFSEFGIVSERLDSFDYTWPLTLAHSMLYYKDPEISDIEWNAYINGFSVDVWITFAIILTILPIVLAYIKARIEGKYDFIENYLHVWGIFCQQGIEDDSYSLSWKITIIFFYLSQLVLFGVYSAILVSYLATLKTRLPFTTVEEFLNDGSYKLVTILNGSDETFFLNTKDPVLVKMRNTQMLPWKSLPLNFTEGFKMACDGGRKIALYSHDQKVKKYKSARACKLARVPVNRRRYQALPLVKDSPLRNFFSYYILRFQEHGMSNRLFNMYYNRYDDFSTEFSPVNLQEIAPALAILLFGMILSFVIMLLERLYFKIKHRHSSTINGIKMPQKVLVKMQQKIVRNRTMFS